MPLQTIQVLPPLIAERIAAGEVIERPASVVKELVENALDAGATQIEVRLREGGIQSIEVIDNGQGMGPSDLQLSVCRHATSKIQKFDDLMNLHTLGFRGEALPSIASVARLAMISRAKDQEQGTESETFQIIADQTAPAPAPAQKVSNENFLGSSHGTRVWVTSLFSQVPARLKFLKSPASEAGAIREILERLSFTHSDTRFKLIHDQRVLLDLPAEPLAKRVQRILGDQNPFELLQVQMEGAWGIQLFWLKGLSQSNTRSLIQVVNGRTLRDRTLQQALLLPFKQALLPGQFPSLLAVLNIPTDELDVNVHPTKTEIRFLDPKKIFALCHAAIQQLLEQSRPQNLWAHSSMSQTYSALPAGLTSTSLGRDSFFSGSMESLTPGGWSDESLDANPISSLSTPPMGQYRGSFFGTYLVFEQGEDLLWIDQHAAHERIRYENLKKSVLGGQKVEEQQLLVPEVVRVDRETALRLASSLHCIKSLGFDAEIFGEEAVVFRSIPAVWGTQQISIRLHNLLKRLESLEIPPASRSDSSANSREALIWDEAMFEKIAMEACRSSYKAGDYLSESNALHLTSQLLKCEHFGNCPHGRPTLIRVSKQKVEEWFQRKL